MAKQNAPLTMIALVAIAASTLHPLNGEFLAQSILRGGWLLTRSSLPFREEISLFRLSESWNPASSVSDTLVTDLQTRIGDQGLWIFTAILLLISSGFLMRVIGALAARPGFAFILAIFGSIGISAAISDPGTALGALLCCLELAFLRAGQVRLLMLLVPIHALVDGSYFLIPFYAPLFGVFQQRVLPNLLPAFIAQALLVAFGVEPNIQSEAFSLSCALLSSAIALCLAFSAHTHRFAHSVLTLITIAVFGALQYATQFPALALIAPIQAAALWKFSSGTIRERWHIAVISLEERAGKFCQGQNRVALFFLAGAFLYFQFATALAHPVRSEILPGSVLDRYVERYRTEVPVHSPAIGGYVGLRRHYASPIPNNLIDSSPQTMSSLKRLIEHRKLFNCEGDWRTKLKSLKAKHVICKGAEPLCAQLRKGGEAVEESRTFSSEQMESALKQFPPEQAEKLRQRIDQEAWFLLELNE